MVLDSSNTRIPRTARIKTPIMIAFLTLCAVSNLVYSAAADVRICSNGRIRPAHPYFLETQDLVLECFSNKPARNLTFQIGTKIRPVKEKWIEYRNETYVKLVKPKIDARTVKAYKLKRFIRCLDLDRRLCIDNVYVKLEYYPKPVTDIECVVVDFQTLSCDWNLGVDYKYPENTSITSKFNFQLGTQVRNDFDKWEPCPRDAGNWTSCYWNEKLLSRFGTFFNIDILVTVTNLKQNISVETTQRFKRDDFVMPSPVQWLTVNVTQDPTCVVLSWEHTVNRKYLHNITFQSECDGVNMEQTVCSIMNCSYPLCGLNPYTSYSISIVSRFITDKNEEIGYWSQPARLEFTTKSTVPENSPVLTPGLYSYHSGDITIFWQPLNKCQIHLNDTVYLVEINDIIILVVPSSEYQVKLPVPSRGKLSDTYIVKVVANNHYGQPDEGSFLEISSQKQDQVPVDSEMIVEYKRGDQTHVEYFVRVRADGNKADEYTNITHTVTWCRGDPIMGCKEPMKWQENVNGLHQTKIPVLVGREEYRFGLITTGYSLTRNKMVSTDIKFVDCIYEWNKAPHKPLPRVELAEVQLPNSVRVDWDPYMCQRSVTDVHNSVSYVDNYVVTYCESHPPSTNNTCHCKYC